MCIDLVNKHILSQKFKNLPSQKLNPIGPTSGGIYTFVLICFVLDKWKSLSALCWSIWMFLFNYTCVSLVTYCRFTETVSVYRYKINRQVIEVVFLYFEECVTIYLWSGCCLLTLNTFYCSAILPLLRYAV